MHQRWGCSAPRAPPPPSSNAYELRGSRLRMWKFYRSRLRCNGLVGTRPRRRDFGGSRLRWRELVGWRGHDGSRLRSTTQLQVVRRGSRIQMFEGARLFQTYDRGSSASSGRDGGISSAPSLDEGNLVTSCYNACMQKKKSAASVGNVESSAAAG